MKTEPKAKFYQPAFKPHKNEVKVSVMLRLRKRLENSLVGETTLAKRKKLATDVSNRIGLFWKWERLHVYLSCAKCPVVCLAVPALFLSSGLVSVAVALARPTF